ncbi:cyclohexanone monooxygenase [Rhodococcus wratislaviensis IFP 2016]|uniref:Cyclohexanone monooxygenase n=1 Tax=Rhodococcus wratislaviensis TaxID=44752 RepID=K7WXS3_RHOWR|nr:cyclohexanone monooxygenase [Rhodococcus wratislaviensis]ELB93048.1 cyclohexanone monooxygenase [Rhodococcus wratislaviensis IFP 2016]
MEEFSMTSAVSESAPIGDGGVEGHVLDTLVIGGGFSGLYQLDRLRDLGFSVKVWDAAGGLGGIWWWNCYPGARTDSTGQIYQYSYKDLWKEFDFTELYPSWDGVRNYFEYVDSKLDLTKEIEFNTVAESCVWDEDKLEWTVRSSDGKQQRARTVIVATGFGAKPLYPSLEGLEDFQGECHHTARWPQGGLDMTGKKVVVMGTGSSGVQVIQEAAGVAEHLTVLQRTPNLALPMRQRKLTTEDNDRLRETLPERFETRYKAFAGFDFDFIPQNASELSEEERLATYERMWEDGGFHLWLGNFQDILVDEEANRTFYDFWRQKVHQRVADPKVAEMLAPATPPHPFGVKRPSLEQNYFDVYNQDNVTLIDSTVEPIKRVLPNGIETANGFIECDVLVLGTGFDNNSGGIMAIDITGVEGKTLQDKWAGGVDTYLGLSTAGFPNMLFLYGPQSPSGFCNGPTSAEYQGQVVSDFLAELKARGTRRFESTEEVERAWRAHVDEVFQGSMFTKARSWYWGANVPGKPAQMLNYSGGVPAYFAKWEEIKNAGYKGFEFQ